MSDELHPAVRDIAAVGWIFAVAGAAAIAVGVAAGHADHVLTTAAACLIGWAVVSPFVVLRQPRSIVAEAGDAPSAPVAPGVSRAVWSALPMLAVLAGAAALVSIPVGAAGALLLGTGASQLAEAAILRHWERRSGGRLLYRATYRWAGTNGRVLGRGWFDPANFVVS